MAACSCGHQRNGNTAVCPAHLQYKALQCDCAKCDICGGEMNVRVPVFVRRQFA
jgi:hypothetical protein